jgi:hypothetical protein
MGDHTGAADGDDVVRGEAMAVGGRTADQGGAVAVADDGVDGRRSVVGGVHAVEEFVQGRSAVHGPIEGGGLDEIHGPVVTHPGGDGHGPWLLEQVRVGIQGGSVHLEGLGVAADKGGHILTRAGHEYR